MIEYKINNATQNDLLLHLELCNNMFIPPLNLKVDLKEYGQKIFENAFLVEAWHQKDLIGLIATYFNDVEKSIGFVTNVSVIKEFNNRGVAKKMLELTKKYAIENNLKIIKLEVHPENENAIRFYIKNDFKIITKEANSIIMELPLNKDNNG